jgi:glycosyltransferase involved in cell wall biosynthesis
MSNPRVSICIPTYNRADMVGLAIESALNQSYRDIEVVIVDNASTDSIEEVVSSYDDPRLRFIRNSENLGLFGNFNRCIELSRGDIIHILHSDDYIDEKFTETCVRFFNNHPNVSMTFTSAQIITSTGTTDVRYADNDVVFPAPDGFRKILEERCFIICPSVMVRREVYEMVGEYSREYPYSADYYQWLKITRAFDIAYVRDAVVYYRQGEHSESYRLLFSSPLGYVDTLKIYTQIRKDLGDSFRDFSDEFNSAMHRFIRDCLFAGFTRTDTMKDFSPSFFSGLALGSWSLITPNSIGDTASKLGSLLLILGAGTVMWSGLVRSMIKRVLAGKIRSY